MVNLSYKHIQQFWSHVSNFVQLIVAHLPLPQMVNFSLTQVHWRGQQWCMYVGQFTREDSVKRWMWQLFAISKDTGSPVLMISVQNLEVHEFNNDIEQSLSHNYNILVVCLRLLGSFFKWRWRIVVASIVIDYAHYQFNCVFHIGYFCRHYRQK